MKTSKFAILGLAIISTQTALGGVFPGKYELFVEEHAPIQDCTQAVQMNLNEGPMGKQVHLMDFLAGDCNLPVEANGRNYVIEDEQILRCGTIYHGARILSEEGRVDRIRIVTSLSTSPTCMPIGKKLELVEITNGFESRFFHRPEITEENPIEDISSLLPGQGKIDLPIAPGGFTCQAYWTGWIYDYKSGSCFQMGASGCSNPFEHQTQEACLAANAE